MSLPSVKQAYAFLTPLKGKSSAIVLEGRKTNLFVARFTLNCLATLKSRTLIFDTSCFYGTNTETLTSGLPEEFLRNTTVVTIGTHSEPERLLAQLVTNEASVIIIDDLNALRSLLSTARRNSSIHELFRLIGILSYEARSRNISVLTTVYKSANTSSERNSPRSLVAASDFQITAEAQTRSVTFRCDRIGSWPAKTFVASVLLRA